MHITPTNPNPSECPVSSSSVSYFTISKCHSRVGFAIWFRVEAKRIDLNGMEWNGILNGLWFCRDGSS